MAYMKRRLALKLRPAQMSDVDALFDIYSRRKAMKYWDTAPHADRSVTEKLVAGMMKSGKETRYFVVEWHGRIVGTAGFWRGSEVGYILHPDTWGQGLGSLLLRVLIDLGFDTYGFDHITAEVDPHNDASLRMLKSAGFHETSRAQNTLRIGDMWFDSVYLRLDPAEWVHSKD